MADYGWWQAALAGTKQPVYEGRPEAGFYYRRPRFGTTNPRLPAASPPTLPIKRCSAPCRIKAWRAANPDKRLAISRRQTLLHPQKYVPGSTVRIGGGMSVYVSSALPPEMKQVVVLLAHARRAIRHAQAGGVQ